MSLKGYLISMILASVMCWAVFFFVIGTVNPDVTNWVGFMLFYLSLFMSLAGTAAIAGFLVRFVGLEKELAFRSVTEAFRQSFLFAFFIVASLLLQSKHLLTWFNLLFLIVGLSVLEFFLISYKRVNG